MGFHFSKRMDDPQAREEFWELFWRIYLRSMEAPDPVVTVARDIIMSDMDDPFRASLDHPLWNK